ncbi:hypothetical protein KUTeg_018782 [Tegillarca granosa]|uniref:Uncharacterized protein n=1 Tax=Tegillarca granosa TaxID=220873 RepID=A0ABQ9EJC5_TEGGR|nr:hypothetical protein KUTeg_018782 [Tegillarca granosa]
MVNRLNGSIFSPFIDLMLSCCSLMAFFGFLRFGEFTIKGRNEEHDFLIVKDVTVQSDKLCSKTDPFRQGVSIHIFNNVHTKPVDVMHEYRQLRISQGAKPDSPLFVDNNPFLLCYELKIGFQKIKYTNICIKITLDIHTKMIV